MLTAQSPNKGAALIERSGPAEESTLDRLAERFCKAIFAGLIAGLAVGVGARIAMRIVALAAGIEPEFTIVGTLFILILAAILGAPLGPVFLAVRKWLPGNERVKSLAFGALVLVFPGIFFLVDGATDPTSELQEGPLTLGVVLFEPVPKAMLRPAWVNDAHHTG